jgi:signal transduction histidine kinase
MMKKFLIDVFYLPVPLVGLNRDEEIVVANKKFVELMNNPEVFTIKVRLSKILSIDRKKLLNCLEKAEIEDENSSVERFKPFDLTDYFWDIKFVNSIHEGFGTDQIHYWAYIEKVASKEKIPALSGYERLSTASINKLSAHISHTLRSPLTPVLIGLKRIQADTSLSLSSRQILEIMERNLLQEIALIDDMGNLISNFNE